MNQHSCFLYIWHQQNKKRQREKETHRGNLDPNVRRGEAREKALTETREAKLTHGNLQISKILHILIHRSCNKGKILDNRYRNKYK